MLLTHLHVFAWPSSSWHAAALALLRLLAVESPVAADDRLHMCANSLLLGLVLLLLLISWELQVWSVQAGHPGADPVVANAAPAAAAAAAWACGTQHLCPFATWPQSW